MFYILGLSNEEKYKVWLRQQYQNVIDKLLEFLQHKTPNIQVSTLSHILEY